MFVRLALFQLSFLFCQPLEIEFLVVVLSFSTLKMTFRCLVISDEKSTINLIGYPFYVMDCFSLILTFFPLYDFVCACVPHVRGHMCTTTEARGQMFLRCQSSFFKTGSYSLV